MVQRRLTSSKRSVFTSPPCTNLLTPAQEHQVLSARLEAMSKKLARETKIRDAALSLSKVNAAHKKVSRQTAEQLDAASVRVDSAQRDLSQVSSRASDVHRRLMEHRAAVLSFSVRSLERKIAGDDSGYESSNRSTLLSPPLPASPAGRFDGAHFFAGHADAVVPKRHLSADAAAAELAILEDRLRAAQAEAVKKESDMLRELSMVQLEKQEVETLMGMDLQAAEETIAALEKEIPRLESLTPKSRLYGRSGQGGKMNAAPCVHRWRVRRRSCATWRRKTTEPPRVNWLRKTPRSNLCELNWLRRVRTRSGQRMNGRMT